MSLKPNESLRFRSDYPDPIPAANLLKQLADEKERADYAWKNTRIIDAARMRAVEVLLQLEWSGIYSYCTGWPCCPVCKGIRPGFGYDEYGNKPLNSGHHVDCKLKAGICT